MGKAFTLVELIVVITILAILGTIAFISLQGFSRDARDSARISDLKSIEKGFELLLTQDKSLPQPEDYVEITASGTVISYQGYAGKSVMGNAKVFGEGKDPLDDTYYTYVSDINLRNYQLLGFLENGEQIATNNNLLKETQATDYSNRFPIIKGKPLGIIVDPVTKEPIQATGTGIDLVTETNEYKVYLDNSSSGSITGTGLTLRGTLPNASCKRIKDINLNSEDGVYTINPEGTNPFEVYCDMTTDGGGWTRISKYVIGGSLNTLGVEIPNVKRLYFEYQRNNSSNIYKLALNEIDITADGHTLSSVAELSKYILLKLDGGPLWSGGIKSGIWKVEELSIHDDCIIVNYLNTLPGGLSWGRSGTSSNPDYGPNKGEFVFGFHNHNTIIGNTDVSYCKGVYSEELRSDYVDTYVY